MLEKWQSALFDQLITSLFSKIPDQQITWFQFNLILKEGCIKYRSLTQQLKFRKHFQRHQSITKPDLRYLLSLTQTIITNNKRYFVESQEHRPNVCFQWWKAFMTRKYGPDIKWFDVVCMRKDCFKLKAFQFKANLGVILRNTEHANCGNTVAAFFPKTQRNEIEFSIFMNTIKVSIRSKYIQSTVSKRSLNQTLFSAGKTLTSKSTLSPQLLTSFTRQNLHKTTKTLTQTSQAFYLTEWESLQSEQKVDRYSQSCVKGRMVKKKNLSKSISSYYSVPVKDFVERQIKRETH